MPLDQSFRGLLSVYSRYGLHARQVAYATLYTGGSDGFVSSAAAPIATGWSEPVPGRDFHPLWISALSRRTRNGDFSTVITGIFRVDEGQTLSSGCLKHSCWVAHRATWDSISTGRWAGSGINSNKSNLNQEASWDLPVIRRDDSWRSRNVVHDVCVEHDLQVLAAPVLGCLLCEL